MSVHDEVARWILALTIALMGGVVVGVCVEACHIDSTGCVCAGAADGGSR